MVFDPDTVEMHNVAASYYTLDQAKVKMPKAQAIVENLCYLMPVDVLGVQDKMPGESANIHHLKKPVMIISTDSKSSRSRVWSMVKETRPGVDLIIDARSGWDVTRIYTCRVGNPASEDLYTKSLQGQGGHIPCSARAVAYNSIGVGSTVAAIVKSYAADQPFPRHVMMDHMTWTTVIQR